jgi:RHS repeat-associated protein
MNRKLSTDLLTDLGTTWSDYDGDEAYGDFTVSTATPPVVSNTDAYELGVWSRISGTSNYLHNDILGTLRQTTGTTGAASGSDVFTAFGERISGTADRFGYVGAFGYQSHSIAESTNPDTAFPFLHIGERYYDPSSGRFLQRDPIGILGGRNVYAYVGNSPTDSIDPEGLWTIGGGVNGVLHLGCVNFQLEFSIHIGFSFSKGFSGGVTVTGGVGGGVGVGGSVGLVGTVTTAPSVEDLLGGATEVGIDTPTISGGGIVAPGYIGGQIGVGVGPVVGFRCGPTFTGGWACSSGPLSGPRD